jgi:ferredoxin-NADP reductase
MAMVRTGIAGGGTTPMRLVYSTRTPDTLLYGDELRRLAEHQPQVDVELRYTRRAPEGWSGPVGRLDAARLAALAWPPADRPAGFVCGPTGFVEAVANLLVDQGYAPEQIKTERFGPTGS